MLTLWERYLQGVVQLRARPDVNNGITEIEIANDVVTQAVELGAIVFELYKLAREVFLGDTLLNRGFADVWLLVTGLAHNNLGGDFFPGKPQDDCSVGGLRNFLNQKGKAHVSLLNARGPGVFKLDLYRRTFDADVLNGSVTG